MTDIREQQISDLLALRDGALSAADAAKVLARPEGTADLGRIERLRDALRSLPDPDPDQALWGRIQAAATPVARHSDRGAVVRFPGRFLPYAAAAGLLLALGAGMLGVNADRQTNTTPDATAVVIDATDAGEDPLLQVLHERSKRLEPLLVSANRRDPLAQALRLRIADLDGQITGSPDTGLSRQQEERLWGQRVALLESLAEVRRARAALQPAVY